MNVSIVLGSFYGDEGKGQQVARLAKIIPNQLASRVVVRFNGGHQAGHTVVREDGHRHVFSSFCSGALHGAASAISRFCTVNPAALVREYAALEEHADDKTNLTLYVDPRCPVTTPFDMLANEIRHARQGGNMTVGVGFGDTIERHENSPYRISVADLCSPMLSAKLDSIYEYYNGLYPGYFPRTQRNETDALGRMNDRREQFLLYCEQFLRIAKISRIEDVIRRHTKVIFEGAQGIQLDMDHGVFPYVTRSNTTCKNAFKIIEDSGLIGEIRECAVYYVTRPYITRHGDGPMPAHKDDAKIIDIGSSMRDDTNKPNAYQGSLRFTEFDLDLFTGSVEIDRAYHPRSVDKHVVVSHEDLHPDLCRSVASALASHTVLWKVSTASLYDITRIQ